MICATYIQAQHRLNFTNLQIYYNLCITNFRIILYKKKTEKKNSFTQNAKNLLFKKKIFSLLDSTASKYTLFRINKNKFNNT